MNNLKWLLPRLPLPMLALAASYGVYQFALLFVPWWVALIQAAAFEVTYIGLAMIESETAEQRRRATAISVGAVVVSVLYNSLAGFLHRNGLGDLPIWGEVLLATLHGAPLAIVAYLVADLLLHKSEPQQVAAVLATESPQPIAPLIAQSVLAALPLLQPDIEFSAAPSEPVAVAPAADSNALPDWLIDDDVAETEEQLGTGLPIRAQVYAILDKRKGLKNEELYALMPGKNQGGIRAAAADHRNGVPLKKPKAAALSHNGNGRH